MNYRQNYYIAFFILIFIFSCSQNPKKSGQITFITGDVFISKIANNGQDEEPLRLGQFVTYEDQIRTGKNSSVELQMNKHGLIRVSENTIFRLIELENNRKVEIQIDEGKAGLFIDKLDNGQEVFVSTPTLVASVRGTKFLITNDSSANSKIALFEGAVAMQGKKSEVMLDKPGEMILKKGQEANKDLIVPLSPESIADMKAFEEMGNLDLQKEPNLEIDSKKPRLPKLP